LSTEVTLTVTLAGSGPKRALAAVLAPDNEGLPKGLRITPSGDGRSVRYVVESVSPATALSTALALLRDVSLFQEVWLLSHGKDARGRRAST